MVLVDWCTERRKVYVERRVHKNTYMSFCETKMNTICVVLGTNENCRIVFRY